VKYIVSVHTIVCKSFQEASPSTPLVGGQSSFSVADFRVDDKPDVAAAVDACFILETISSQAGLSQSSIPKEGGGLRIPVIVTTCGVLNVLSSTEILVFSLKH
jgi:hypothetical protein